MKKMVVLLLLAAAIGVAVAIGRKCCETEATGEAEESERATAA